MRSIVTANTYFRSEASDVGGNASVVLELKRGDVVNVIGRDPSGRWSRVSFRPAELATEDDLLGYVSIRDLEADSTATAAARSGIDIRSSAGTLAHDLTKKHDDVGYMLGAKASPDPSGHIDCSGWTAWVGFRVMDFANESRGRRVFSSSDKAMLNTHSDGQIEAIQNATGYIARNETLRSLTFPLYLIGLNFGNYTWEGSDRVYGIDHVVITVLSDNGDLMVSQSSSSGGGVNFVKYANWYEQVSRKPMYGVDLMLLGSWLVGIGDERMRDIERRYRREDYIFADPDTRHAQPG